MRRTCIVLLLVFAAVTAHAANPIPEFAVVTRDGQPFSSRDFSAEGRWLMIYVAPDCGACDGILGIFSESEAPNRPERVVVILAGDAAQTRALASRFPALSRAHWYADPGGAAGRALQVPMRPTVLGLQDRAIGWSLPFAASPDRAAVELRPLLANWLQPPQP